VPQLLTCPHGHHWDLTEHPFEVLARTHGLCPQCGEPPTADSPVDWYQDVWGLLVLVPLLFITVVAASVPALFLAPSYPDAAEWPCLSIGAALLVSAVATDVVLHRRRRAQMRAAAGVLALDFLPKVPRRRARELGLPPFLWKRFLTGRAHCLHGRYQGSNVVLLDGIFRATAGQAPGIQSAVVFLDPLPGVLDFYLAPRPPENRYWRRTVDALVGVGALNRFAEEPFGPHYRLESANDAAAREWLSPPLCDFLRRHPGWVFGVWQGRVYLYWPGRRCSADACGTFLAVAWRLRELVGQGDDP
jgi:hypothetical protein